MLLYTLLRFMNCCIGVTTVVLSGRIVTVPHVIISMITLSRDVWVRSVIINSAISTMGDRVIPVGILPVHVHMVRLKLAVGVCGSCCHLHLP